MVGPPAVWEVIAAARNAPGRGEQLVEALPSRSGYQPTGFASQSIATPNIRRKSIVPVAEEEAEQLEQTLDSASAAFSREAPASGLHNVETDGIITYERWAFLE